MKHHADRLRRLNEACEQLTHALAASFRVREHAEEVKGAAEDIAQSAPSERRAMPRVKNAGTELPSRSELEMIMRSRER